MDVRETLLLLFRLVDAALRRDVPLPPDAHMVALIKGVRILLRAGAYSRDGQLFMPRSPGGDAACLSLEAEKPE